MIANDSFPVWSSCIPKTVTHKQSFYWTRNKEHGTCWMIWDTLQSIIYNIQWTVWTVWTVCHIVRVQYVWFIIIHASRSIIKYSFIVIRKIPVSFRHFCLLLFTNLEIVWMCKWYYLSLFSFFFHLSFYKRFLCSFVTHCYNLLTI